MSSKPTPKNNTYKTVYHTTKQAHMCDACFYLF